MRRLSSPPQSHDPYQKIMGTWLIRGLSVKTELLSQNGSGPLPCTTAPIRRSEFQSVVQRIGSERVKFGQAAEERSIFVHSWLRSSWECTKLISS